MVTQNFSVSIEFKYCRPSKDYKLIKLVKKKLNMFFTVIFLWDTKQILLLVFSASPTQLPHHISSLFPSSARCNCSSCFQSSPYREPVGRQTNNWMPDTRSRNTVNVRETWKKEREHVNPASACGLASPPCEYSQLASRISQLQPSVFDDYLFTFLHVFIKRERQLTS